MTLPTTAATMPPLPATTSTRRTPSPASSPLAVAMPTDAAPNMTAEYSANTRPAIAGGACMLR